MIIVLLQVAQLPLVYRLLIQIVLFSIERYAFQTKPSLLLLLYAPTSKTNQTEFYVPVCMLLQIHKVLYYRM